MFLAFVPAGLSGLARNTAWRVAHAAFAIFHASVFVWYFRQARQLALPASSLGHLAVILGLGVFLAEASVALGFLSHAAPYLYLLALLWFLFLAATAFIALVFPQFRGDGTAA